MLSLGVGEATTKPASASPDRTTVSPEELWQRLFSVGSLRGAELDGGWGVWDGQRLAPNRELRRRFDQLLTTVGEISAEELSALLAWLAERDLGAQGAQQVMLVWDRYLKLQFHVYKETIDLAQPHRWGQVLQEHQLARRHTLGHAWADAFFRDEEDAFRQRLEQAPDANASAEPQWTAEPPLGISAETWHQQRSAALGPEAANRLQLEERAQAEWNQRLNAARMAVERLSSAPELSAVQRQEAIQTWLDTQFHGTDRLRASALLGI